MMWQATPGPGDDAAVPRHAAEPVTAAPPLAIRVGAAAVSLTVVAALVVVGWSVVTGSPRQAAEPAPPPSATPSASPSVSPAPGPDEWRLPERTWAPLPPADPASPLYGAQSTALDALSPVALEGCPTPTALVGEEQWRLAVAEQWRCVHASWAPVFAQLGWPADEPALEFFAGEGTDSDCGYLEAPAFYCASGSGHVYFGDGHYAMATAWVLSVNEMVNHEYGHHLQHLSGVTAAKLQSPHSAELERRAELQATCWAATMTMHNTALAFDDAALASWMARLDTMLVDGVHGSRESIRYWGTRGLYAETLGDCNTWVVAADAVD